MPTDQTPPHSMQLSEKERVMRNKKKVSIPLRAADARRSVTNILEWNCYLPCDCVKTMVRMGWDYTT